MTVRDWVLEHPTLFRLALFLCCTGYWTLAYAGFRPRGRELAAGIMAAWVQFGAGVALDLLFTRLGFWHYLPLSHSFAGIPLDLHLDWALTWAFSLCWLYSRSRSRYPGPAFPFAYLGAWVLLTVLFDLLAYRHLPFVRYVSSWWWLADAVFLEGVLGVTLWAYHTSLFPSANLWRRRWGCRLRTAIYIATAAGMVYGYLPALVLTMTDGWGARPLLGLESWPVLALALAPPLLVGAWANLQFADRGDGTAIPLDPPRRLVTTGPYAYIRNPMQIAGIWMGALVVLYHPTWFMLVYGVDLVLASTVLIYLYERPQMEESFGAAYEQYRRHVRNWIPRLRPYVASPFPDAEGETTGDPDAAAGGKGLGERLRVA